MLCESWHFEIGPLQGRNWKSTCRKVFTTSCKWDPSVDSPMFDAMAAEMLIGAYEYLSPHNRRLALEGMLRDDAKILLTLKAIQDSVLPAGIEEGRNGAEAARTCERRDSKASRADHGIEDNCAPYASEASWPPSLPRWRGLNQPLSASPRLNLWCFHK